MKLTVVWVTSNSSAFRHRYKSVPRLLQDLDRLFNNTASGNDMWETPPDLPKKDVRSGSCPNETMLSGRSSAMFWNRCEITSAVAPVQSCELFLNEIKLESRVVGHASLLRNVWKGTRLGSVSVKERVIWEMSCKQREKKYGHARVDARRYFGRRDQNLNKKRKGETWS